MLLLGTESLQEGKDTLMPQKLLERWMLWTLGESVTRTISVAFTNVIGRLITTTGESVLATFILGLVQMLGGTLIARAAQKPLWIGKRLALWCFVFAVFAVLQTVLLFLIFARGGDMGVTVFIISLSVIFGALVDWFVFRRARITLRGWAGISLGAVAAYAVLGFPGIESGIPADWWLLMAFAIMLMITANQGVTVIVKDMDPHVKNAWVGLYTTVLCAPVLLIVPLGSLSSLFYLFAVIEGVVVIGIIVTNLMAYKGNALMAIKKLTMFGLFLALSAIVGMLFFGDPFSWGKIVGIVLFVPAFYLLQTGTERLRKQ